MKKLNYTVVRTLCASTMILSSLFMLLACGSDPEPDPIPTPIVVTPQYNAFGTWYSIDANRELRIENDGHIYLTYADLTGADSKRGNYTLNYTSPTTGRLEEIGLKSRTDSVTYILTWSDENTFRLSSSEGTLTYHKVKETLGMKTGESKRSNFITQYDKCTIVDDRFLSLEKGNIVSSGIKGYTYIEVDDINTTYFVKVRVDVDEDYYDLWYDYTPFFGYSETELKNFMGMPTYLSGEYWLYELAHESSPYVKEVVFICDDSKVKGFYVDIAEGVSMSVIQTYIKDKFYLVGKSNSGYDAYANKAEGFDYYLVVDTDERTIFYYSYQEPLWEDLTHYFGNDKQSVKTAFNKYTLTYEEDRYLQYSLSNTASNIVNVAMWFEGKGLLLNQILVEYKSGLTQQDVDTFLSEDYIFKEEGSDSNGKYRLYFNEEGSIGILFYPSSRYVVYYDLTQESEPDEPETSDIIPNFIDGLDKTQNQVQTIFGTPYSSDETKLNYVDVNDIIDRAIFFFNSAGLCYEVLTRHIESVESNTITDFFNSKYYPYEGGANIWINAQSFANATAAIFYYPENCVIDYVSFLTSEDKESRRNIIQKYRKPMRNHISCFIEDSEDISNVIGRKFNRSLIFKKFK